MNSFKFKSTSITKNWPGGRKFSQILKQEDTRSWLDWNRTPINFQKPYFVAPPAPSNEGGMASPDSLEQPSTIAGQEVQVNEIQDNS